MLSAHKASGVLGGYEITTWTYLLDEAIEAVVDNTHRRLLPDRLRRQAWLMAQIYEEDEMSLWALAAAAALEEGVFVEHPLLREMMNVSFLNAVGRHL